jgi:hypothetical protein
MADLLDKRRLIILATSAGALPLVFAIIRFATLLYCFVVIPYPSFLSIEYPKRFGLSMRNMLKSEIFLTVVTAGVYAVRHRLHTTMWWIRCLLIPPTSQKSA